VAKVRTRVNPVAGKKAVRWRTPHLLEVRFFHWQSSCLKYCQLCAFPQAGALGVPFISRSASTCLRLAFESQLEHCCQQFCVAKPSAESTP